MAINLDNVKSITHNNKEVVKIEDSNGNTIWQKKYNQYMYGYTCQLDTLNKAFGNGFGYTSDYNVLEGQRVWYDGTDFILQIGAKAYKVNFSTKRFTNYNPTGAGSLPTDNTWPLIWFDGTNVIWGGSTYDKSTNSWSGNSPWGTHAPRTTPGVFLFKGNLYYCNGVNKLKLLDTDRHTDDTEITFSSNFNSGGASDYYGVYAWSPDGNRLFWSSDGYQSILDVDTGTTTYITWTGDLNYFIGADVVRLQDKLYVIRSGHIYEMDIDNYTLTNVDSQFTGTSYMGNANGGRYYCDPEIGWTSCCLLAVPRPGWSQ